MTYRCHGYFDIIKHLFVYGSIDEKNGTMQRLEEKVIYGIKD